MRSLSFLVLLLVTSADLVSAQQHSAGTGPPILPLNDSTLALELQKSKGKVLVVNVWATWCEPCVQEFPDLLKLRRTYASRGLDLMFISVDDNKHLNKEVRPFLKRMKVTFPTYIKQPRADAAFMNVLSREWHGALPATFVFDKAGTLVKTFIDATSFDELASTVKPLFVH